MASYLFLLLVIPSLVVVAIDGPRQLLRSPSNNEDQQDLSNIVSVLKSQAISVTSRAHPLDATVGRNIQACTPCGDVLPHGVVLPPRQLHIFETIRGVIRGGRAHYATTPSSEIENQRSLDDITVYDLVYFFLGPPVNHLLSVLGLAGTLSLAGALLVAMVASLSIATGVAIVCLWDGCRRLGVSSSSSQVSRSSSSSSTTTAADEEGIDTVVQSILDLAASDPMHGMLQNITVRDLLDHATSGDPHPSDDDVYDGLSPLVITDLAGLFLTGNVSLLDDDMLTCHLDLISCETNQALVGLEQNGA